MKQPIDEIKKMQLIAGLINEVEYNESLWGINKQSLSEVDTKEAKADEAVKAENKAKTPSEKKPKELHIDQANPYEYRHGIAHELNELGEYTDEALEKAKVKVLKNLAKDANFYSTLLNQKQSPYEFKQPETDKPGMQARPDGHLKKEAKKDEKSNVKDNLGKKEAGKLKPKGIKIMPDKGVTGSEKTIKEGIEIKQDQDEIEISDDSGDYYGFVEADGTVSFSITFDEDEDNEVNEDNWKEFLGPKHAFVKIINTIGGDVEALGDYVQITVDAKKLLNSNIKEGLLKESKYISTKEIDGETFPSLNKKAIADYLKSVIDPSEIKSVNAFMRDEEGFDESASYFFDTPDVPEEFDGVNIPDSQVEDWAKQEMSYYLFSSPDEFPGKEDVTEHHNDPNFPGGPKIYAMLDAVAKDWGKEDLYNELEDAITGWSDRNGELSPKGKIAIKALLSNWDVLDDYGHFLDDTMEEGSFMGGVDLGSSFDKMKQDIMGNKEDMELADENAFEDLIKKYDWYYEMSDDPRVYDNGVATDKQLKMLAKKIGVEKAVDLFNQKAPKDRKVSASFFMEGEDKHAKLKEILKQKIKETLSAADIAVAKQKGSVIQIPKSDTSGIDTAKRAKVNFTAYE